MKKNSKIFFVALCILSIIQFLLLFIFHSSMTTTLLVTVVGMLGVGFYLLISANDDYLKIKNYELEIKRQEIELETKKLELKMQEINTSLLISENSQKFTDEKKEK